MSGAGQSGPRIVALTPNPAVDITYVCDDPVLNEVNRVTRVLHRPGGKGINVASVARALGRQVVVGGFLGGRGGSEIRELLQGMNIRQEWTEIDGETRRTVAVQGATGTTMFNEPGPEVTPANWKLLVDRLADTLHHGDVLVVSGSCPPGTRETDIVNVLEAARMSGARTLVDTSGPMLIAAAPHADVLKPNGEELREATGCDDVLDGVRFLNGRGAGAVIVSEGEAGMTLFYDGEGSRHTAAPPEVVAGNPTGAGDAAMAALAADLLDHPNERTPRPAALASAVALSASAVLCPTAGSVDLDAYHLFLPDVTEETVYATHHTR